MFIDILTFLKGNFLILAILLCVLNAFLMLFVNSKRSDVCFYIALCFGLFIVYLYKFDIGVTKIAMNRNLAFIFLCIAVVAIATIDEDGVNCSTIIKKTVFKKYEQKECDSQVDMSSQYRKIHKNLANCKSFKNSKYHD